MSGGSSPKQGRDSYVAASDRDLKVFCATWNVGNKEPTLEAITQWLGPMRGYDVIAIGVQEGHYSMKAPLDPADVERHLGVAAERRLAEMDTGALARNKRFGSKVAGTMTGMLAGGLMSGPLLPFGMLMGAVAGYKGGSKAAKEYKCRSHWWKLVKAAAGPEYQVIAKNVLLEMRLAVLVRTSTVGHLVSEVEELSEATGLLKVVGNKGAVGVRLRLGGTSLCIFSCHLMAHMHNLETRNAHVREILRGMRFGVKDLDADIQSHHTFFMGDLNYRLDPRLDPEYECPDGSCPARSGKNYDRCGSSHSPRGAGGSRSSTPRGRVSPETDRPQLALPKGPSGMIRLVAAEVDPEGGEGGGELSEEAHRSAWLHVVDAASAGDWRGLQRIDQLRHEMQTGEVLAGFEEGPTDFPPTFKFVKGDGEAEERSFSHGMESPYTEKRVPSWCDRVLWQSLPGRTQWLRLSEYRSLPDVCTSDHKPVVATFDLHIPGGAAARTPPPARLRVLGLTAVGLRKEVMREAGGGGAAGGGGSPEVDGMLPAPYKGSMESLAPGGSSRGRRMSLRGLSASLDPPQPWAGVSVVIHGPRDVNSYLGACTSLPAGCAEPVDTANGSSALSWGPDHFKDVVIGGRKNDKGRLVGGGGGMEAYGHRHVVFSLFNTGVGGEYALGHGVMCLRDAAERPGEPVPFRVTLRKYTRAAGALEGTLMLTPISV